MEITGIDSPEVERGALHGGNAMACQGRVNFSHRLEDLVSMLPRILNMDGIISTEDDPCI